MINKLLITNHLGESIELELRFPERSGFLVQRIDGLGPSKATINTTELATKDGSQYNSGRVMSRNIVLSLVLLPYPTIEASRQRSYVYFPIKQRVRLRITTDNRVCETDGYVETNEVDIFSKQESTVISMICPDAYFYSDYTTLTVFSGVQSLFSFPFSNNSLDTKVIKFGDIIVLTEKNIRYSGDAEIGVTIRIHAIGPAEQVVIYNTGTRDVMTLDTDRLEAMTGSGIIAGDDIIISTVKGNKFIYLIRDGMFINILNCLDRDSNWFQLSKGDNLFAFTVESGGSNLQFRIENQTAYEGI